MTEIERIRKELIPSQYIFPGLNELRALAALCVIPGHIEQMKQLRNISYSYWFPIPGKLGVVLFFSLSGFLITTLLLAERTNHKNVGLRTFYLKRILRIWPLYFLVVGLSILVINNMSIFQLPRLSATLYSSLDLKSILLLLLIMPNLVGVVIPYASQAWSIGIEEQFYLVQPFIIKYVRNTLMFAVLLVSAILLKELMAYVDRFIHLTIVRLVAAQAVYFGCIAIGCLGALIFFRNIRPVLNIIYSEFVQVLSLVLFIISLVVIYIAENEQIIDFRLHAVLFTIFIVNAATNPTSIYRLDNGFLDYLGKISYGMYMYHVICIGIALVIVDSVSGFLRHPVLLDVFIYIFTMISTIAMSSFSYKYYECYFLSLRRVACIRA